MEALFAVACSTKSDHMRTAEGKKSKQRQTPHQDPGHGEMQSAPALPLDQQACGHNLSQGSYRPPSASLLSLEGFKSFPQSQELKSQRACIGYPQTVQMIPTTKLEPRPSYLLSLTFDRGSQAEVGTCGRGNSCPGFPEVNVLLAHLKEQS